MPRRRARPPGPVCVALLAVALGAGPAAGQVAASAEVARARALADSVREAQGIPGLSMAVGVAGEIVWSEGFGFADRASRRAVTTETLFRIGSVSKSVTAAGLVRPVEQGRLDLDAPIQLLRAGLPGEAMAGDDPTVGRPSRRRATLPEQRVPDAPPVRVGRGGTGDLRRRLSPLRARLALLVFELWLEPRQRGDGGGVGSAQTLPLPSGIEISRGWAAVDASVEGRTYRIVGTHLESDVPIVRLAQASERLQLFGGETRPLVVLGDFNSGPGRPETQAYQLMVASRYLDVWTARAGHEGPSDGYTCCHAGDLSNAEPTLVQRIDLIFARNLGIGLGQTVARVDVVGDAAADRQRWGV